VERLQVQIEKRIEKAKAASQKMDAAFQILSF